MTEVKGNELYFLGATKAIEIKSGGQGEIIGHLRSVGVWRLSTGETEKIPSKNRMPNAKTQMRRIEWIMYESPT